MRYCITEGDIDMVINEWPDEWRIPTITREVPETTAEGEVEQSKTQPLEIQVPKKPQNGPRQADSGRQRVQADRDPKGEERNYIANQRKIEKC